jgi:hypothetical protein
VCRIEQFPYLSAMELGPACILGMVAQIRGVSGIKWSKSVMRSKMNQLKRYSCSSGPYPGRIRLGFQILHMMGDSSCGFRGTW